MPVLADIGDVITTRKSARTTLLAVDFVARTARTTDLTAGSTVLAENGDAMAARMSARTSWEGC